MSERVGRASLLRRVGLGCYADVWSRFFFRRMKSTRREEGEVDGARGSERSRGRNAREGLGFGAATGLALGGGGWWEGGR